MASLYSILQANAGQPVGYTPPTGVGSAGTPAGTNGYDYGSGSDPGDFWRNIGIGGQGLYSNTTKNYFGVGGAGWNPAAASAGYLATQGGPDNPVGFRAWMSGDPQYVAAFGPPPAQGTTFDQFRTGTGLSTTPGVGGTPTLYNPPPGAPGAGGVPPPAGGPGTNPGTPGIQPPPGSGAGPSAYPLDIASYLDPGMKFRLKTGEDAIGNAAAGAGNFLSGSTLKGLTDFAQQDASQEWANAFQRATQQQGFNYGVDTGDRNFAYQAMTGDRAYNAQVQEFLATLGMQGAQGQGQINSQLAQTIAQLMSGQGQIQGSGTIGGNNSITGALQSIISQLQSGSTLQSILAALGGVH